MTAKATTPYVAILYADVAGLGEGNPTSIAFFVTGWTHTVPNTAFSGRCFKARSPQDALNCLCGVSNLAQTAVTHGADGSVGTVGFANLRNNSLLYNGPGNQGRRGHSHSNAQSELGFDATG
ncbi:MAG: hypothetical protein OXC63_00185 [Aestuariivita sp.]|nr:hypothetical protein [Aestuariivita sp.]MCY4347650.1 hypothetical protein [Aestuariivita sp.]